MKFCCRSNSTSFVVHWIFFGTFLGKPFSGVSVGFVLPLLEGRFFAARFEASPVVALAAAPFGLGAALAFAFLRLFGFLAEIASIGCGISAEIASIGCGIAAEVDSFGFRILT